MNKELKEELKKLDWKQPKGVIAWAKGDGTVGMTTPIDIFDWNVNKSLELLELGVSLSTGDTLKKQICFQQSVVMIISAYEVYCADSFGIRLITLIENNGLEEERIEKIKNEKIKCIVKEIKESKNKFNRWNKLIGEEMKWNFQNLQNCKEMYKEVFKINLCHDLSKEIEKKWNEMVDYTKYRHGVIHTAGMYCKPANIDYDYDYVRNCLKIFVNFIHKLEDKLTEKICSITQTGTLNLYPSPPEVVEGRSIFKKEASDVKRYGW